MSSNADGSNVFELLQQDIEQLRNENLFLKAELEEQKVNVRQLNNDNDYLRKKTTAAQQEAITYGNSQTRLETQLYAQEQENAKLRKEIQQLTKARNDAEKKLAQELQNFENDRMRWQQREADMYNQIRSLGSLAEPRTPRTPRRRSITTANANMSPFNYPLGDIGENEVQEDNAVNGTTGNGLVSPQATPKLDAINASYAREAKIAQRTIKAQDKLIADLKNEIEKQKKIVQELTSEAREQSLHKEHLEHEIANIKQLNQSLMEDNESYQILLHEKTITGEFMANPIMQVEKDGQAVQESHRSPRSSSSTSSNNLNLAAELNIASVGTPDWEAEQKANETDIIVRKLSEENKTLQDTNRALQLYMNKILMRIINDKQLVDVLSIDQPKPQPPPAAHSSTLGAKGQQKTKAAPAKTSAPAPSRTLSSTLLGKGTTGRHQRRRTISYWGKNVPPASETPASELASDTLSATNDRNTRRHSTIVTKEPERPPAAATTTSNGGWAKALRRMSGIGWSKPDESADDSENSVKSLPEQGSQKLYPAPSMSQSTSTTSSSLRRSNELEALQEE